jgi:glycosyltransferase involved in cell wall biosynthesis
VSDVTLNKHIHHSILFISPVLNEQQQVQNLISALNSQSSSDFFCIFVDSGSDDDTVSIIRQHIGDWGEVTQFDENLGVSRNWSRALEVGLGKHEADYVMFLAGDDTISSTFVENAVLAIKKLPDSRTTLVPNFKYQTERGEVGGEILGPQPLTRRRLALSWELVHIAYSIVPRDFAATTYLKILKSAAVNFDWWIAYEILSGKVVRISEIEYLKYQKGMDYESAYYTGKPDLAANSPSSKAKRLQLLNPIKESMGLMASSGSTFGDYGKPKKLAFLAWLILARYYSAARLFLRR